MTPLPSELQSVEQVAAIFKCAAEANYKVQAKSGGHSYGNYGYRGVDGAIVVDLKNFQQFSMDNSTYITTIGAGTLLGDVTTRLHNAGGRATAHGICPQVALDHIVEAEVVLANSSIIRASETENPDAFFAVKGAAPSFGIVTEFKVRTEPEPGSAVQYSYTFNIRHTASRAKTFRDWQTFISQPDLTRKFSSIATSWSTQ
ncbi:hypothetical protein VTN00DRAFT_3165 [Thermoascus crustaceus]|uniref:uncharacterized protein n=1 Tax=Thermoascus crustaceus TaxID=5088 RepID=UPI0037448712